MYLLFYLYMLRDNIHFILFMCVFVTRFLISCSLVHFRMYLILIYVHCF